MLERRRTERIRVSDHLTGHIAAAGEARIVDISTNGALVEVSYPMKARGACQFSMELGPGEEIHLDARVQRCGTSRYLEDGLGKTSFWYRAALEFIDIDSEVRARLEHHLDQIKKRSATPDTARIAQMKQEIH